MKRVKNIASTVVTIIPRTLVVTAMLAAFVATASIATPSFAAVPASYSCGSYGSGNYSYTAGAADCGATPGAPNTGFAQRLMQPSSIIAIVGSILLIIAGIVLVFKARRKKAAISFNNANN